MSKLACRCGNIISDVVYPSATEGWLTGEEDDERLRAEWRAAVGGFVAALLAGRRREWLRGFFLPEYPHETSDEAIISDIVSHFEQRYKKSIAECARCGRLWVQVSPGQNQYRSYAPDEGGYAAILRGRRE